MEMATVSRDLDLIMEEVRIDPNSRLCGKALRDSGIRGELEVIVIAIIHESGEKSFNPSGEMHLAARDRLVVVGKKMNVEKLEVLALGGK